MVSQLPAPWPSQQPLETSKAWRRGQRRLKSLEVKGKEEAWESRVHAREVSSRRRGGGRVHKGGQNPRSSDSPIPNRSTRNSQRNPWKVLEQRHLTPSHGPPLWYPSGQWSPEKPGTQMHRSCSQVTTIITNAGEANKKSNYDLTLVA